MFRDNSKQADNIAEQDQEITHQAEIIHDQEERIDSNKRFREVMQGDLDNISKKLKES